MVSQRNALSKLVLVAFALFSFSSTSSFARNQNPRDPYGTNQSQGDGDLIRAIKDRRNVHFIEGTSLKVVEVLPDDTQGSPHQKWIVQLSSGDKVLSVYNSDMGVRVPLKIGDTVELGGEFKMTNVGPLIHWLHDDPRNQRPHGYVVHKGLRYGSLDGNGSFKRRR